MQKHGTVRHIPARADIETVISIIGMIVALIAAIYNLVISIINGTTTP
jgi:hypothetical protein